MKKVYEKPEVTKVDFKFEDAIAASGCSMPSGFSSDPDVGFLCKTY